MRQTQKKLAGVGLSYSFRPPLYCHWAPAASPEVPCKLPPILPGASPKLPEHCLSPPEARLPVAPSKNIRKPQKIKNNNSKADMLGKISTTYLFSFSFLKKSTKTIILGKLFIKIDCLYIY